MNDKAGRRGFSRRDFLKGSAAGALGVAATGLLAACSQTDDGKAAEATKADRVTGYSGPGDWLGTAPKAGDISSTVDVDVVVVGGGHAGTQAALAAAEAGATVAVIEMQAEDKHTYLGEDIGAWNSKFAADQGVGAWDLGEVVDEFVTRCGGRSNPDIVKAYVENSGETLDNMLAACKAQNIDSKVYTYDNTPDGWLIIQMNMDYDKIAAGKDIYECLNKTNYPLQPGTKTWVAAAQFMGQYNDEPIQGVAANSVLPKVQDACLAQAESLGAKWYWAHTGVVLTTTSKSVEGTVKETDREGNVTEKQVTTTYTTVTGVVAKDSSDKYVQFNAKKGVIVTTGDYAANAEMCWALNAEAMELSERAGGKAEDFKGMMGLRDGSGLKMMCWAGAWIENAPRAQMAMGGGIGGPWGTNCMLWLNSKGERFCNEGNITGASHAIMSQAAGTGYLVTDSKWLKSVCNGGVEHGGPNAGRPQYFTDMINGMNAIQSGPDGGKVKNCTIAERGYTTIIKADTLDQLADYLGVPAEVKPAWLASIERYNQLCAAGKDTDYGKKPIALIPVNEGPFYGITGTLGGKSGSIGLVTLNGVLTDKNQNVLDKNYNNITGLYTAGNCLGGRYGTGYATPCAGNSIGMAVTHGRVAGKIVAAL
ncbi:MAG: FAD-binding protein [Coriobacteriia bacterium]